MNHEAAKLRLQAFRPGGQAASAPDFSKRSGSRGSIRSWPAGLPPNRHWTRGAARSLKPSIGALWWSDAQRVYVLTGLETGRELKNFL